jgi:colanic acid/amylovoran biosynthesis glycosyltransferase
MRCSKIIYLVSHYPAFNHTYILREVRELRKLGWDIDVASIRPDTRPISQLTAEEQEERSRTWSVTTRGVSGALHAHLVSLTMQTRSYFRGLMWAVRLGGLNFVNIVRNWIYFTEALIVGQWMQRRGLTHIHIHFASTVGLLIAKTFPITISITVHGPAEFADAASFHLREKIEAAEFICAISEYGHGELMKSCDSNQWGKLETVPLGIDPNTFAPIRRSLAGRSSFDVVSVGRLSPEKAQHVLIDAVASLVNDGRQVRLRLVGDGPDRPALEKHIVASGLSGIVRLDGVLNQDQLKALYQESDIFALASLAEGVPVVLMEAMAMGIPCVATRITGIPELIENGQDGLLVPPSDVLQLSTAIAQLMDDPVLRERIAKAGRSKVIEKYNLSKNVALLAEVFERRVSGLLKRSRAVREHNKKHE